MNSPGKIAHKNDRNVNFLNYLLYYSIMNVKAMFVELENATVWGNSPLMLCQVTVYR